jgi:hypothetical protein
MDHNVPPNSSDQHGLKRSHSVESTNKEETTSTSSSSSKRFMSVGHYLHQILFLDGTGSGSNIKISSLDRTWDLHRAVLRQSPYFSRMFDGQWLESDQNFIEVHIVDPNIYVESLNITFESLYKDDVDISSDNVVGVLAAATMFLLDDLTDRCVKLMKDKTDPQSIMRYLEAGQFYGQP